MDNIFVYDVTLRDGEQAPGFHMNPAEKVVMARQLVALGVDGIEAGFAISSPGDKHAIEMIAQEFGQGETSPVISSLARAVEMDIDAAAEAVSKARNRRIHTFIATSKIHIEEKLRTTHQKVMSRAVAAVERAKRYTTDVEFSLEDFSRTEPDYAIDVISATIKAGATTINMPDTVGWFLPTEAFDMYKYVITAVKQRGYDAVFSVHNHNDMGLATANTIMGVMAGARQVEVTVSGCGERAGNASLEQVVMSMRKKGIADTRVNSVHIMEASRTLSRITGIEPQPNYPIIGANAFAHASGIHQDGVIKSGRTYEIIDPAEVGAESRIVLTKRSGKAGLSTRYAQMGLDVPQQELERIACAFTEIADIADDVDDAHAVMALNSKIPVEDHYRLIAYNPVLTDGRYGMVIKMQVGDKTVTGYYEGNGPIDAAVNAINGVIGKKYVLKDDLKIVAQSAGSEAKALTQMSIRQNGWKVVGTGEHTDSTRSAILAYVSACNRMRYMEDFMAACPMRVK